MTEDLIDDFERYIASIRRPRTAKSYAQGARKLEKYLTDEAVDLNKANSGLMGDFVQWMVQTENLEAASVKLFTIGATRFLDYRRGQGEAIPTFGKPDLPKVPEHEVEVLTRDQVRLYLGIVDQSINEPSRTALLLLPFTGLRSGEMSELRLNQIGVGTDKGGKKHIMFDFAGKGAKRRKVPVADRGKKILQDYLEEWREEYRDKDPENIFLFPGRNEGHVSPRTLRDSFAYVRERLKMPSLVKPHIMRKTYCTELLNAGFHIQTVADVMGHSSIQTTYKFYTAAQEEAMMEAGNLSYH